jgi:hypothetical protein
MQRNKPHARLTEILEEHRSDLLRSLQAMRNGDFTTHSNGEDTTEQSIQSTLRRLGELDEALKIQEGRSDA